MENSIWQTVVVVGGGRVGWGVNTVGQGKAGNRGTGKDRASS